MNEKKLNNGEVTFHNEGKKVFVKYILADGIPHGPSVVYNDKEEIIQQAHFVKGMLEGEMCIFEKGRKLLKMNFKNNLQHGDTIYYDKDENEIGIETYAMGLKEGKREWRGPGGKLMFTENYIANKLNGEKLEYYENGKVKKRSIFVEGEPAGAAEEYYKNGWKKRKLFK